jgi:AcrR family transcriptional regulator
MSIPVTPPTPSKRQRRTSLTLAGTRVGVMPAEIAFPEEEARERIIGAALRAFAERGFNGTSIPDIASAAQVGVASIYRRFTSKEHLVNAVFRETKGRLRDALLLGLDLGGEPRAVFLDVWSRLASFQRSEPLAFQFLEMQDHVPYLDGESRAVERSVLGPLLEGVRAATGEASEWLSPAHRMAMIWGAFVGLAKAARLGYLALDEAAVARAGEVCFTAIVSTPNHEGGVPGKARRTPKGE